TYHLDLVLVLRAKGQEVSRLSFRVVLDRRGIRSLHEIAIPGPLGEATPDSRITMPRPRPANAAAESSAWHTAPAPRSTAHGSGAPTDPEQRPARAPIHEEVELLRSQ